MLSLYADSHDDAIGFYCHTLGLFSVYVDAHSGQAKRRATLNYVGAKIPLSLMVMSFERGVPPAPYLYAVELFHPDLDLAYERLTAAGFATEMMFVPLGRAISLTDPFGNKLFLTDKEYESYELDDD